MYIYMYIHVCPCYTCIHMYTHEYVCEDHYECPGGHIWHWSDIVDAIENLTPPELYNLCFLAEQDKKQNEKYYDLTRGA